MAQSPAFASMGISVSATVALTRRATSSMNSSSSAFTPRMYKPTKAVCRDALLYQWETKHEPLTMLLEQTRPPTSHLVTDSRRKELSDFIQKGPIFKMADMDMDTKPGCTPDFSGSNLDDWIQLGSILEESLADQANDVRVYQYYLPVYFWVVRELKIHKARIANKGDRPRPFILGFCCPQGGGKTTMTNFIQKLLGVTGMTSQVASLDDFYVTNSEQRMIAAMNDDNRLLQFRGMPGTHDLPFLNRTLDALRKGEEVSIPRYDKTAFGGRGDRARRAEWKHIGGGQVDVVLLEGWCLGFEPVPVDTLIDEDLLTVNDALCQFVSVYTRLDGIFVIEIENMDWVFEWRLQAERATRAAGKPGLADEQVRDFVSRFMPAYKQYSQQLYNRRFPLCPRHELHIAIDKDRKPILRKDL